MHQLAQNIDEIKPAPGEVDVEALMQNADRLGITLEEYCELCANAQAVRGDVAGRLNSSPDSEFEGEVVDMSDELKTFNRHKIHAEIMECVELEVGAVKITIDCGDINRSIADNIPKLIEELEKDEKFNIPLNITIRATAKERYVDLVEKGLNDLILSGKVRWERVDLEK